MKDESHKILHCLMTREPTPAGEHDPCGRPGMRACALLADGVVGGWKVENIALDFLLLECAIECTSAHR